MKLLIEVEGIEQRIDELLYDLVRVDCTEGEIDKYDYGMIPEPQSMVIWDLISDAQDNIHHVRKIVAATRRQLAAEKQISKLCTGAKKKLD
tara:strand:- start:792 stop:1064 length:273 start_codon:yes stop_codon:yes gene_type:complete